MSVWDPVIEIRTPHIIIKFFKNMFPSVLSINLKDQLRNYVRNGQQK